MPQREPSRWDLDEFGEPLGVLPFSSWLSGYGVPSLLQAATTQGIPLTTNTVYDWVSGRHAPRDYHAMFIVELSEGALSLEDVYGHRHQLRDLGKL